MLILLLAACTPLVGDWEGTLDCGTYEAPISVSLEFEGGEYVGDGELDCSDTLGGGCQETFEIHIQSIGPFGEQDLDVDLDDCEASWGGYTSEVDCDDADDLSWDGADEIEGDWGDCDVDLDRQ